MSNAIKLTLFTITFNQRDKVGRLLDDLAAQDYDPECFEVIVLDDGSTDGTSETVRDLSDKVPYRLVLITETHEADYQSARRWNQCIASASPESAVFIQVDDVRLRSDFITKHMHWHTSPALRLVTGAKFEGDVETWDPSSCRRAHLAGPNGTAGEVEAWTAAFGASLSYPRTLVDAIWQHPHERPFDERMTGWGYHEVDFSYRATQAGATLIYDPAVGVFHQNHGPVADAGRGIDHAAEKARGAAQNERHLMTKHGLSKLPRW
jgi:glycosyltransferase involved in cell wall biosynthesis